MSLHMIVQTHNPESCAFRSEEDQRALVGPYERLEQEGGDRGVAIRGSWVNRASHEVFVLVDAPDAHAIDDALVDVGLVGRTHSRVLAVTETGRVVESFDEQPD